MDRFYLCCYFLTFGLHLRRFFETQYTILLEYESINCFNSRLCVSMNLKQMNQFQLEKIWNCLLSGLKIRCSFRTYRLIQPNIFLRFINSQIQWISHQVQKGFQRVSSNSDFICIRFLLILSHREISYVNWTMNWNSIRKLEFHTISKQNLRKWKRIHVLFMHSGEWRILT